MQLIVSSLCSALFCWAMYQVIRGEAFAHTTTITSPVSWISRDQDPDRYWNTVIPQAFAGMLPVIAVAV